ncbi:MAG: DUF1822 family protein, partial [Cyanobacteria bacterium P01_G01_bin.38]
MKRLSETAQFTAPLSTSTHRLAQQFRHQHRNPQKAKQVYLNTLAVSAVEFYLRCMGVDTDWSISQSYDPIMQSLLDVADLDLPGKGKLECRPLLETTTATALKIPLEICRDRIAHIAVQLAPSLQEATLLGFVPANCEEIVLDQLRSLDDLADYLNQIQPTSYRVNLSNWLENLFETGWQSLTALTG